jgi:hypothetical protein
MTTKLTKEQLEAIRQEFKLTIHTYLAAHAPDNFPIGTYKLEQLELPPEPVGAAFCEGCKADSDCDGSEACRRMQAWNQAKHNVRAINLQWAEVQRRFIYADAMISELQRRQK